MLNPVTFPKQYGFSLIELLIGLAIVGLLLFFGLPTYQEWIQNIQIRAQADSLQNGLTLARNEAIKRNTTVRFQLVTSLDNACGLSTVGTNWVVSLYAVSGLCDLAPDPNTLQTTTGFDPTANPLIIQKSIASSTTTPIQINAGQASICMSSLGALTSDTDCLQQTTKFDISSSQGTCTASGGTLRCMRVCVSTGGQVRMCDPAITDSTDPRYCSTSNSGC